MAKYTKHSSNYIRTDRHQFLKGGSTIFERDWVTIGSQLHFGPGKIPYYNNGNFVFTTSPTPFYQKRHRNGESVGTWTYDDVANAKPIVNKISFDEYTEDIRSFAYYGSCVELVRSSVEKIIKTFPGMVVKTNDKISYLNGDGTGYVSSKYYAIQNDFGYDFINQIPKKNDIETKFLRLSYKDYLLNDSPIVNYTVIEKAMFMLTDEICYSNQKEKNQKYGSFLSKKNYALRGGTGVTVDGVNGKIYWVNKEMEAWQNSHPSATVEEIAEERIKKENEFNTKHQPYNNWLNNGGQTLICYQQIPYINEKQENDDEKCSNGDCLDYAGNCYFGYSVAGSGGYPASDTMAKGNFTSINAHKNTDNETFSITKTTTLYYFYYYNTKEIVIKNRNTESNNSSYIVYRFSYNNDNLFDKRLYITLYSEKTLRKEYVYLQAVSKDQYETNEDSPITPDKVAYKNWRPNDCPIRYWTEETSFEKQCDNEYKWESAENDPHWNYVFYSKLSNLRPERNQELYLIRIENEKGDKVDLYAYILDYELVFMTPYTGRMVIRPKDEIIEKYFDNLKGFERKLLTRESKPLYSNQFLTPIEYSLGYVYYNRTYTWPSNDYCIDISSPSYSDFIEKLIGMAELYDELWTDNLWRRMTHEAIKNYDWTYTRHYNDGDEEDNVDGGERMHKVLNIIGRVFDDVKRSVDTIRQFNKITYNSDRNIPNALISDKLENTGWDMYSTIPTITNVIENNDDNDLKEIVSSASTLPITNDFLSDNNLFWYPTKNADKVTFADVDIEWMKRFLLSSRRILSTKGTIQCIDMIMAMFGYGTSSYDIREEYYTVTPREYDEPYNYYNIENSTIIINKEDYDALTDEEKVNYAPNKSFGDIIVETNMLKTNEKLYNEDASGIPVGSFMIDKHCLIQEDEDSGLIDLFGKNYLIPFYNQAKIYDGDLYFQSKGGWFYNKKSDEDDENVNPYSFKETLSYLHVVPQVSSLLEVNPHSVEEGDIYYVVNVNDYFEFTETNFPSSHFFVLENVYSPENFESWTDIDLTEAAYKITDDMDEDTKKMCMKFCDYAAKARYLNDIIPDSIGNNPHVGYGSYDNGKEYFEYMKKPFKYSIDTYNFNYDDREIANEISFDVKGPIKTGNVGNVIYKKRDDIEDTTLNEYVTQTEYDALNLNKQLKYEKSEKLKIFADGYETTFTNADGNEAYFCYKNNDTTECIRQVQTYPYKEYIKDNITKLTKDVYYLNSKVLYFKNLEENENYKNYFKNIIMKYIMQVIPSTTIMILEGFE